MNPILNSIDFIARSPGGVALMRKLVLELAVRGKLVPQDPRDEPASVLLERIKREKARLVKEGKIKAGKELPEIKEEEKPYELPKGWLWTPLGEITNYGNTIKPEKIDDSTWVLDLEDIEKDTSRIINHSTQGNKQALSDKNMFSVNDVLYGKLRPYLNKVIVADQNGVCTTEIVPFHCYTEYIPHYFRIVLMSPQFVQYATQKSYGMKMPRLGKEDARKSLFPLPPLSEQSRIVARVHKLMAVLDRLEDQKNKTEGERNRALIAATQSVVSQAATSKEIVSSWLRLATDLDRLVDRAEDVKTIRAMVLELAMRGKLVPQDPRDEPASVLLERIQREKARLVKEGKIKAEKELPEIKDGEKPFALPRGWVWMRLGDFGRLFSGGTPASEDPLYWTPQEIPWVCPKDMKKIRIDTTLDMISRKAAINCNLDIIPADSLLIVVRGMILVKKVPIAISGTNLTINQDIKAIKPFYKETLPYLYLYLEGSNPDLLLLIERSSHGTCRLDTSKLTSFRIALPPLTEQTRIIARVQGLMTILDRLEEKLAARDKAAVLASESIVKKKK